MQSLNRSDQEALLTLANGYEDWAIGLLDTIDEPVSALPLLTMVPSELQRVVPVRRRRLLPRR